MKNASISQVRDHLSKYLRTVRKGETVIICDRDTPIARLEPISPFGEEATPAISRALAAGILMPPRVVDDVLQKLPPPRKRRRHARLVEALLEERRSGR